MKLSQKAPMVYACGSCGAILATGKYWTLTNRQYDPKCEGNIRQLTDQESENLLALSVRRAALAEERKA